MIVPSCRMFSTKLHRNFPTTKIQRFQKSETPFTAAIAADDDDDGDGPGRTTERFRCENSFTSMGLVVGCCCCCCVVGTVLPLTMRTEGTKTCGSPLRARERFFAPLRQHTALLVGYGYAAAAVVWWPFFRDSSSGSSRARAYTHDVVGSLFHAESHFTRAESAAGRTRTVL